MNFLSLKRAGILLPALGLAALPQISCAQAQTAPLAVAAPVAAVRPVPAIATFRPPSVPLITHDPYFSIWSNSDTLAGGPTRHWTGREQTLSSLVRVDGQTFRLMGDQPDDLPVMLQTGVQVLPTRSIYNFSSSKITLSLEFLTPVLPDNLDVLARPVTYLTWRARSADGAQHSVQVYDDASGQLAVNDARTQPVVSGRLTQNGISSLRIGSVEQPVLQKAGDDMRIDWGYLYVAPAPGQGGTSMALGARDAMQAAFSNGGKLPLVDDTRAPRLSNNNASTPVAAVAFDLGRVGASDAARTAMIAYDDGASIVYMGRQMKPFWAKNGATISSVMAQSAREFPSLSARCAAFDTQLMADMTRAGGTAYAAIGVLAFRQMLAANKIVQDRNGAPLAFSKENNSNGCIATVDVFYPAQPLFAVFSPTLAKATLVPVMNYAASPRWKFPFAPHDLGTYPLANGQVYGGGERTEDGQMPIEETGNLMILLAQIAQQDGNANFASKWWPQLQRWAGYLEQKGFDPENQLSTDDFSGHLAHNTNLSIKATEALGAYAMMCQMRVDAAKISRVRAADPVGRAKAIAAEQAEATRIRGVAKSFADRWATTALEGDHYRLAFDQPNTWSQKYNLVWDKILGFNLYSPQVAQREIAFYKTKLNPYGLPLDNRRDYTKLDWCLWSATMAQNPADFRAIVDPIARFLNDTPDRNPMTDWFHTLEPRQAGFQARSVVGGVFIKMLSDAQLTQKYARRDVTKDTAWDWAAMPKAPLITEVVLTSRTRSVMWRYTFDQPAGQWQSENYDAGAWRQGAGGFGTVSDAKTQWNTPDIWARREFNLTAADLANRAKLQLYVFHDEDADIFINGVRAATLGGYNGDYAAAPMSAAALASLQVGRNVLAAHVHQTGGGQFLDAGVVIVTPTDK